MSDVLDDIGAGKCTVMERRGTFLRRERIMTIAEQLGGNTLECFHCGSQSEGTTTPGLNSDIDLLYSRHEINIMTHLTDWEAGFDNYLMLNDNINPPQQYLLQVSKRYTPEAATSIDDDMCVRKDSGQVILSSERHKQTREQQLAQLGAVPFKNGPSVSHMANWDVVHAFHVCKLVSEIQHWIDRCRGRHWPPVQLLEAARVAPSFLVPAGHPDSDYKREEWRLSPNLIERMLMFSFNMTQIKCYIVLKLIKQSLFNKTVVNSVTSFHCKTLMFYTIERTHHSFWKEHNLMFLLLLCLHELRKWLRLGRFPHYIIKGVNLFDGKLSIVQQRRLLQYVDSMIKNNLQDLFYIDIDKLGCRLQACCIRRIGQAGDGESGRVCVQYSIRLLLKFEMLGIFLTYLRNITYAMHISKITFEQSIKYKLRTLLVYFRNEQFKTVALDLIYQLYALHNSVQSSECLRLRNPVFSETIMRFQYSLNADVASSRLKLASMLYCLGHLHAAVRVLADLKRRYHSKVKSVCRCIRLPGESDLELFANMISDNCDKELSEPPFAFCVNFVRQEAYCAPYILLFEMNRGITEEEVAQRDYADPQWMDSAEVDARPFLHYLQYLTYGGLGERDKQSYAMVVLESYIRDPRNLINLHHCETAFNLLGHCYEMEGDFRRALLYYGASLSVLQTNNAANWHVQRLISS